MISFRKASLLILFLSTLVLSILVYRDEHQKKTIKEDLIELSKIKYGIFNVDEWKIILAEIISKKVEEFNLNDTNRDEMRMKVTNFLYTAIDKIENLESEKNSKKLLGFLHQGVTNICLDNFRDRVPDVTNDILGFLNDSENRKQIKNYIIKKIEEYADKTFAEVDYTLSDQILVNYGVADRASCITFLTNEISQIDRENKTTYWGLYGVILVLFILIIISKNPSKLESTTFILSSLVLLGLGLSLPMIDIDARISEMSFSLIGEPVKFTDQVLYYKSKSILEVVQLMMMQGKLDLMAVGFLVLLFSVLFPLTKLVSSLILIHQDKTSPFVNFMVFKTGKWSMADVMVVAIFMAYIGFSGIIGEQLKQLENITNRMDILTTNQSSLQLGFFMFTTFVIFSLMTSNKIDHNG